MKTSAGLAEDLNLEHHVEAVTSKRGVVVELIPNLLLVEDTALPEDLKERLVLKYRVKAQRLGRSILRRWHARLDLEEVDSLVDLSLCEAVKRYNPKKGASFMTFLYYHLRGNLIRAVSYAVSSTTVPNGEQVGKDGEVSTLGAGVRGVNSLEVVEALCHYENLLPDEILAKKQMVEQSSFACTKLDTLEREVIERIFLKEEQLNDVAAELGYSRCHISRVKKKALETLYDELAPSMGLSGEVKPEIEGYDLNEIIRRPSDRRAIQRRRPRSKKSHSHLRIAI